MKISSAILRFEDEIRGDMNFIIGALSRTMQDAINNDREKNKNNPVQKSMVSESVSLISLFII